MIRNILILTLIFSLQLIITSCSSGPTKDNVEIENALNEETGADGAASEEEEIEDDEDDEDGEELAENDEGDEEEFEDDEDGEDELEEDDEELAENEAEEDLEDLEEVDEEAQEEVAEEELPEGVEAPVSLSEINKINFLSNKNGGSVLIEGSEALSFTKRFNKNTNQFILEIENVVLKESLKRPFITKDFNGPIAAINAYQSENSSTARIVVQMTDSREPIIEAHGGTLVIVPMGDGAAPAVGSNEPSVEEAPVVKPPPKKFAKAPYYKVREDKALQAKSIEEFILGSGTYYGKRISIHTGNEADVREVIRFISEESGVNIVMSDMVKGSINLKLREVPWDQALVILLRSKKLGYVRQGGVLRISTLQDLEDENKATKSVLESRIKLSSLKVKVVPVSYADVKKLSNQVKKFSTKGRGDVISDTRTSSLIIKDTAEIIQKITSLVKKLDIPPPQVMIEAKIVEATQNFIDTFGINWGYAGVPHQLSANGGAGGSAINLRNNFAFDSVASGVGSFSVNIGQLDILGNLAARLVLEESKNTIKVISSPRIMALNNENAEIIQGGQVLTKKVSIVDGVETTTITPRPFSMTMNVTPQVTASGSVLLSLDVTRQFPGADDSGERAINTRSAKTKALVQNGQTAVIGGIFQNDALKGENGIQVLKDIPIIGWLFKSRTENRTKTELLIFVTPRVMPLDESFVGSNVAKQIGGDREVEESSEEDADEIEKEVQ